MSDKATTTEAQGLAARWAHVQAVNGIMDAARSDIGLMAQLSLTGSCDALQTEPLTDLDRERLFAWVRTYLDEHSKLLMGHVLKLSYTQAQRLATAAGWPS